MVEQTDDTDPWTTRVHSYAPLVGSEDIRRWTILGAILGIVFIGGGFGLATWAFGGGIAGALAIGSMTAVFGGLGFGAMMGFVVQYAKQNERVID